MSVRRIRQPAPISSDRLIVGIDPSLTGTGIALLREGKLLDYQGWTTIKKLQTPTSNRHHLSWWKMPNRPQDKERKDVYRQHRIRMMANWVATKISQWSVKHCMEVVVAIEGYAFSKRSSGLSDIHEMCGVIKTDLWQAGIAFRIYDPLSVKLAATRDGSADKDMMVKAAERAYGIDLSSYGEAGENIADAILLASLLDVEMSVKDGNRQLADLSQHQRAVLLRTTKASPVALVSLPMAHVTEVEMDNAIFSRTEG